MRDALSKKRSAMSDTSIDVHIAFPSSASDSSLLSPSAFAPNGGVNDYPLPASHSQLYPPAVKAAAAGELAYGTAPVLKVLKERFGVLASLLVLQSLSSVILQRYEQLLEHHVEITLFLTMVCCAKSGGVCIFSPRWLAWHDFSFTRRPTFQNILFNHFFLDPFFRSLVPAVMHPTSLPSTSFAVLPRAPFDHLAAATPSLSQPVQPLAAETAAAAAAATARACHRLPF
jgi:hypothetical protein